MKTFCPPVLLIVLFLVISPQLFSQQLKARESRKLIRFGIDTLSLQTVTVKDLAHLHEILRKNRQHTVSKSVGNVFGAFSAFSLAGGTLLLTKDRQQGEEEGIALALGGIMLSTGIVEAAVSIPLLIHAKKKKKQRDRLIRKFKATH